MNLSSQTISKIHNKKNIINVNIDNENITIPSFIVENKFDNVDTQSIYHALIFIGNYLKKNILVPNNLNYPISRKKLENFFR